MKATAAITLALVFISAPAATAENLRGGRELATITDTDILNFALNLECLEAEFYSWAAFGHGLSSTLLGGGPPSRGGMKAKLWGDLVYYAEEIANNEINHVALLRSALGSAAVPCPLMDIGDAFAAAANAALGTKLDPPYSPYANGKAFVVGAFVFEDVGVTAYHGAAPLITDKGILSAAAGILGIEAYHAGAVRTLLGMRSDKPLTPYSATMGAVANAISDLRAAAGGGKETRPIDANGDAVLVPADGNSVAFARTPQEVLAIVYLGSASTPGGFFPNGMNGNIR